jgi:ubiquinone/menaquinone biosynthesis C-methylase UbiE
MFDGADVFERVGQEFLSHFRDLCGLRPNHHVLDIGCGIGRIAIPLTTYLDSMGTYDGIDISRSDIRWCQGHITPRHRNFRFHHADLYNRQYNPSGALAPDTYVFPYSDRSFDFVCAISLFTHILHETTERYLAEIARVLRPQGVSLFTFFVLNEDARESIRATSCGLRFIEQLGDAWIHDSRTPEAAVAYEEPVLRKLLTKNGLKIQEPIHAGSWPGRKDHLGYQDTIIVRKGI